MLSKIRLAITPLLVAVAALFFSLMFATGSPASQAQTAPSAAPAALRPGLDFIHVCTDAGAGGYEAFPDVCRLSDGRLMCVFYAGHDHVSFATAGHPKGGRISCCFSSDEGRTWSAARLLFDGPDDDRDPSIVQLPSGRLLCNFFILRRKEGPTQPAWDGLGTWLVESDDLGRTWSAPRRISADYYCSSPVRVLPDGRLMLGLYREEQGRAWGAVTSSADGGRTWGPVVDIPNGGWKLDAETDVVRLADGTLLAAEREKATSMCWSISKDGGRTWSVSAPLGFPGHCPYFLKTRRGVLLLAHRLPQTSLHWSLDDGRTWSANVLVDDLIGAYPSMVELRDGSILIVYYEEGAGSSIRARKFAVDAGGVKWLTFGSGARSAPADKGETLKKVFARKIAYTKASPFYRELHTPHLRKFHPGPWRPGPGEALIDSAWSVRAEGTSDPPGPFALEEIRTFFADAGGFQPATGAAEKEIVLRIRGRSRDTLEADGYSLNITETGVAIESPTWRGVLYGVYDFERLLLERGIPALQPLSRARKPLYGIRMFGDVYGTFTVSGLHIERPVSRDTFSALSRFGANATFTFVQLGDYLDGRTCPELRNPDCEKNLAELNGLAEMAKSAGVTLFLDAYNPKLPAGHPLFKAHPNAMGATQHGGDIHCLCPSDPETLKFIADSWAEVFRRVPSLGGMVAIIGGEGFYHCFMRSGKGGPDCPRCAGRRAEDVVADLTNTVFRAVRKVRPEAEFLAWPYSAFTWSADPFQLGLIARLDPGIQIVPEIDKDFHYAKDGYVKDIWDYSIDFLGPSDRYMAMSEAARRRGLKVCAKTETAVSLEMNGVPYIPCLQRWGERAGIVRGQRPDSVLYAYDVTGFSRSRPEELAGRLSWEPSGTAAEEIRAIALRDFGSGAADEVVGAWADFSQALGHTSYLTHGYYKGPSFIGPGQPLMLEEAGLPPELFGRFFYLAENDLSEGTIEAALLRPIYAADIRVSAAEMADMDKAVALWDRGVERLAAARTQAAGTFRPEIEREFTLCAYLGTAFRAICFGNHFFSLRAEYSDLLKDGRLSAAAKAKARGLLAEMEKIVQADLDNARKGLAYARQDPRLDLAVRLDLDYQPLARIIEAKIAYAEGSVREQFAVARSRLSAD